MNIKEISKEIHENAIEKGFWEEPVNFAEKLMLVVSGLSEAMEADRKGHYVNTIFGKGEMIHIPISNGDNKGLTIFEVYFKNTFEDEIADAVIRLFDLATKKGIDLEWHIEQKVRYNKTRPYKHNKAY